jgi:hypothetical protein
MTRKQWTRHRVTQMVCFFHFCCFSHSNFIVFVASRGEINVDKDEYNKLFEKVCFAFIFSYYKFEYFLQVNAIAQPMVDRKLAKKVYNLV